jgi:hypothetical protein
MTSFRFLLVSHFGSGLLMSLSDRVFGQNLGVPHTKPKKQGHINIFPQTFLFLRYSLLPTSVFNNTPTCIQAQLRVQRRFTNVMFMPVNSFARAPEPLKMGDNP